jgi:type VI secretion system protein ImpA
MSVSVPTLDFERLLSPIPGASPCGESLRWDPVWDELSQFRKTRKDPLDANADKSAEWGKVIDVAIEVLSTRTKDLLIAGWLTEALVRESGFAGFRDGLHLVKGFVDRFWEDVHPQIEDGDVSNRAAPFAWLTSHDGGARMPAALREVPIARSSDDTTLNWNFWHLRRVTPQGKEEKEDAFKRRTAEAEQKRQIFDSAVEASPIPYYQTLLADMDACLTEIDSLSVTLDERLGDQSPNWSELRKSIGEIRVFVHGVLKRRGGLVDPAPVSQEEGTVNAAAAGGPAEDPHSGPIRSRAHAIERLEEVANYFRETEPHSPVAYLVRRAARWAGMPFEEVLGELIKDDKLVKQISETLGIVPAPPSK